MRRLSTALLLVSAASAQQLAQQQMQAAQLLAAAAAAAPELAKETPAWGPVLTAVDPGTAALRGNTEPVPVAAEEDKALWGSWFSAQGDSNYINERDGGRFLQLKITPWSEATTVSSNNYYNGGRLEFKVRAVPPIHPHTHTPTPSPPHHINSCARPA